MNLSLQELGKEYDHSIKVQKDVIEKYRKKLNEAQKSYNFKEVNRLNRLLKILYDEKSELEELSNSLKSYYKPKSKKPQATAKHYDVKHKVSFKEN